MHEPDHSLCALAMSIMSREHAEATGGRCPTAYVVGIATENQSIEVVYVSTVERVADLVVDLAPQTIAIDAHTVEEEANIRAAIALRRARG